MIIFLTATLFYISITKGVLPQSTIPAIQYRLSSVLHLGSTAQDSTVKSSYASRHLTIFQYEPDRNTSLGSNVTKRFHRPVSYPARPFPPYSYGRNRADGKWIHFHGNSSEMFAYSAFYDDRLSLKSVPVIRVIAVLAHKKNPDSIQVFCVLHYADETEPHITSAEKQAIGIGVHQDGNKYKEFILTCKLLSERAPDSAELTTDKKFRQKQRIPVEIPERLPPNVHKFEFGVCVSVSYWSFDLKRLVEWLEMQRILGVSLVTIYNNSLSEQNANIFRHYAKTGFVDFRQSHNFVPYRAETTIHMHMSPVINDCIYRNMHRFRKILVIDLDEIIMPHNGHTLADMMREIDQSQIATQEKHPAQSYAFRNIYMFLDVPPDESISSKLVTLRYRKQAAPSPVGYSSKSIIDPQSCTHMHNHYCWNFTPLYASLGKPQIEVDPNIGSNRHYKKCHFSKTKCKEYLLSMTPVDVALKYKDELEITTKSMFKELGLR